MSENTLIDKHLSPSESNTMRKEVVRDIGSTASSLAKKQLALSEAKLNLDHEVQTAKKDVYEVMKKIISFATDAKDRLFQRIDDISSRRRLEMEDMSATLINVQPQLLHILSCLSSIEDNQAMNGYIKSDGTENDIEIESLKKLANLRLLVDSTFSGESWEKESITTLGIQWKETVGQMIDGTEPLHSHIRVLNYLAPEELSLKLRSFIPVEQKLDISVESPTKRICKALLTEISLKIYTIQQASDKIDGEFLQNSFVSQTSVKDLVTEGMARFESETSLLIACPVDLSILNEKLLLVEVTISGIPINLSPLTLYVEQDSCQTKFDNQSLKQGENQRYNDLWTSINPGKDTQNITRTGKLTNDLDESDMKAMDYLERSKLHRKTAEVSRRLSTVHESLNEHPSTAGAINQNSSYSKLAKDQAILSNQLPLNQPSPMAAFKKPLTLNSQSLMAAASPTQRNFMPSIRSTENNLEKKLEEFKKNGMLDDVADIENEKSFNVLEGDSKASLELSRLQERLSGAFQPINMPNPVTNGNAVRSALEANTKSVSFHQNTTIYEQIEAAENEPTDSIVKHADTLPYQPGTIDNATLYPDDTIVDDDQNQWKTKLGQTKETDGEQLLTKAYLQMHSNSVNDISNRVPIDATFVSNGSINASENTSVVTAESMPSLSNLEKPFEIAEEWKLTSEEFQRRQKEAEKKSLLEKMKALGGVQVMWEENKENQWEENRSKKKYEFDLTSQQFQFKHVKTLCVGTEYSEGLPQSVTKDNILNRIYVSDINLNCIYKYTDWECEGIWAPEEKFMYPRYILCVPDFKHDNRNGMNVVVLDQVALYYYRSDGALKSKLFSGQGCRYRGLTYNDDHGHVITTEKVEGEGVYLVFIELNTHKDIVKKILLEPTALSHYQILHTKCRFLSYKDGRVITTDMGLNCYYITNLKDNSTTTVNSNPDQYGKNDLRQPTGVFVDPSGNVVVAASPLVVTEVYELPEGMEKLDTSLPIERSRHANQKVDFFRGKLQLFSPNGAFIGSLTNVDIEKPAGLCFDGKYLYVADTGPDSKVVEVYTIAESSPRKRKGSFSSPIALRKQF